MTGETKLSAGTLLEPGRSFVLPFPASQGVQVLIDGRPVKLGRNQRWQIVDNVLQKNAAKLRRAVSVVIEYERSPE